MRDLEPAAHPHGSQSALKLAPCRDHDKDKDKESFKIRKKTKSHTKRRRRHHHSSDFDSYSSSSISDYSSMRERLQALQCNKLKNVRRRRKKTKGRDT